MNSNMRVVRVQKWREFERGWGDRPDGCSLHLNSNDAELYIKSYWNSMSSQTPDEYECPVGELYFMFVTNDLYDKIEKSVNGIRLYRPQFVELLKTGEIKNID